MDKAEEICKALRDTRALIRQDYWIAHDKAYVELIRNLNYAEVLMQQARNSRKQLNTRLSAITLCRFDFAYTVMIAEVRSQQILKEQGHGQQTKLAESIYQKVTECFGLIDNYWSNFPPSESQEQSTKPSGCGMALLVLSVILFIHIIHL
jgi:superoxide dismutase